jgi:hypothetical protein
VNIARGLSIIVIFFGVIALAVGAVFVWQGVAKNDVLVTAMREEKITLGITGEKLEAGEVIDNAAEAEAAADTIREHRHSIAPTYGDLLGGEPFDPTDPTQLIYAQALNLENYLYLAVLGFGVTQIALGAGAFMIFTGLALISGGAVLLKLASDRKG